MNKDLKFKKKEQNMQDKVKTKKEDRYEGS
jgi:hypothetical protein